MHSTDRVSNPIDWCQFDAAGSGESGKSTIFKQMRLLHKSGFSTDEKERLVDVIKGSILSQMQVLLDMAAELDTPITDAAAAEAFAECDPSEFDSATAEIVSRLWKDPAIQSTYELRSRFQLNDSAA